MHTRLWGALGAGLGQFLRTGLRVARQISHEMMGSLFFAFALFGGVGAWREWRKGSAQWLIALAIGFSLMMGAFAVASFRSARRVR